MASHIQDAATGVLVGSIHNNPMSQSCTYSYQARTDVDGNQTLIAPKAGLLVTPLAEADVPPDLPIAEEINKLEFLIL